MLYTFHLGGFWGKDEKEKSPSARPCLQDTFGQVLKAATALPVGYL